MAGNLEQLLHRRINKPLGIGAPADGGAQEVGVIRREQLLGRCIGRQLHQTAAAAHKHLQRVGDLGQRQLLRPQVVVAGRLMAQIDHRVLQG